MIDAGEVGAVFRVIDDASPVLRRLIEQFEALERLINRTQLASDRIKLPAGLNASVTRLGQGFSAIAEKSTAAATKASANLDRIEQAALTAVAGVGDVAKAFGDIGVASGIAATDATANFARIDGAMATTGIKAAQLASQLRAVRGPAVGAIGGAGPALRSRAATGGAGGGGGPHFGRMSAPLPGGAHVGIAGDAGLAALGAIGYGVYLESEIEDIAARALLTGQIRTDANMRQSDAFKSVRDTIQRVSAQTGYGPKEVGESILMTERQFGGLSFADRLKLEETLIPFAASEARMKEATLPEAFEAMVGLAHMTGTYDPKQLPELMRQFSYASMITPVPIEQFQRAISYSLPMLHAGLDMDPSAVMFLTAMTQTAGITNTKSGTWLRSFFENAEPREGISKTDITHNTALQKMGLLDQGNKVTWQVLDAAGKTDWDKSIVRMSELINKFTTVTDPATRLATLKSAFGERGGGEAALMNLSQFIEQFPVLQAKMKAFMGGDDVLKSLHDASPVQQARNTWADLENILMDIGSNVLPPLTAGLGAFDEGLKALKAGMGEGPTSAVVTGGAVAGALAMTTWGRSLLGKAWGLFGGGGGATGASAPAAVGSAGLLGGFMSRVAPVLALKVYEDDIKADVINPLLESIFGAPSKTAPVAPPTVGSAISAFKDWLTPSPALAGPKVPDLNPLGLDRFQFDEMTGGMDREANRAKALSGLPKGITDGVTTGMLGASPFMKTAFADDTTLGVLAGLRAASGEASGIIASWAAAGMASATPRLQPIPPPRDTVTVPVHVVLKADGRTLAELVTTHQVKMGAGAAEGSPYHDSTWSTSPIDFVTV